MIPTWTTAGQELMRELLAMEKESTMTKKEEMLKAAKKSKKGVKLAGAGPFKTARSLEKDGLGRIERTTLKSGKVEHRFESVGK